MIRPVSFLLLTAVLCGGCGNRAERSAAIPCDEPLPRPSEYVSTLVGTQSDYTLSAGNTYPAVALPWGKVGGQAVLGRQSTLSTPWLTERHGYDPTSPLFPRPLSLLNNSFCKSEAKRS